MVGVDGVAVDGAAWVVVVLVEAHGLMVHTTLVDSVVVVEAVVLVLCTCWDSNPSENNHRWSRLHSGTVAVR